MCIRDRTWDDRVSFMLTEGLQLKKLSSLSAVFEGNTNKKHHNFYADVVIATSELRKPLPDLLEALGGETALASVAVIAINGL